MKRIYILGVNGNARDVLETIRSIRIGNSNFPDMGGFLDDQIPNGAVIDGIPVCGPISSAAKLNDACFVNAIGSPESYILKPSIIAKAGITDSAFVSIIHPSAVVSPTAHLGKGSVVLSNVSIGSRAKIGNHVMILQNCVVSHDSQVEDYVVMATGVCLSGNVSVERNAYLGSQSCVRGGLKIGTSSLVGMGSVIVQNVPAGEVWCGNPAEYLRHINPRT